MKLSPTIARQNRDPRAVALPLLVDDQGLATRIQSAPSADEAWRMLGLPGGRADVDPVVLAQLLDAASALCTVSDAIGKGLGYFGDLAPDADPPVEWVDRMVELYVQELEGFWHLDDLAVEGLGGGWAVAPEHLIRLDDPAGRIAERSRWQAEHLKPKKPALWLDKLDRLLARCVAAEDAVAARTAGRALVQSVAHWRFTNWRTVRSAVAP